MLGIEISEQAHDIMSIIQILAYPLVAWMWHRVGFGAGSRFTLDYLEQQGLLEFEQESNKKLDN